MRVRRPAVGRPRRRPPRRGRTAQDRGSAARGVGLASEDGWISAHRTDPGRRKAEGRLTPGADEHGPAPLGSLGPWTGVELRHLAALRAIACEGSFRGAAARLGFTQSAISQQIAILERRIGHRLIDRSKGRRSVALTDAGEVLLRHANAILGLVERAHVDFRAFELRRAEADTPPRPASQLLQRRVA